MKPSVLLSSLTLGALAAATPIKERAAKLQWLGVDESVAEFGQQNIPGLEGKDYTFPATTSLDTLISQGFNIFRVPFLMERMVPNRLTGSVAQAYFQGYANTINHITGKGAYAVLDPHNYGRYYNNIIQDTAGFQAFWKTIATQFKSNDRVIFDTNNEYHDMDQTLVLNLNQAAINGIRAAGATKAKIGHSYEMHQYLDSDGSGTSATCVSSTVGVERVVGATNWLKANGKKGFLGEFAGGANTVCQQAVTGMLQHLQDNSDVWTGAAWWAGGPWADYIFSFEPPSGTGYTYYLNTLKAFL
ncbi:MAG: hypothetical protein Q9159_004390 [Coniocarpon cinnabarinum]